LQINFAAQQLRLPRFSLKQAARKNIKRAGSACNLFYAPHSMTEITNGP